MSISTYSDLQNAIVVWTKRADLANYYADFITMAEGRIQGEIRSRDMEERSTASLSSTTPYITLPTDFLELRALWLTSGGVARALKYATPAALLQMYPDTSATGEPNWFTIIGTEIRCGQVPDSTYSAELWYYKRLAALSSSVPTLFTNNPDLYLSASLVVAFQYIKDEERAAFWDGQYQTVKARVNMTEERGRRGRSMQMVAV